MKSLSPQPRITPSQNTLKNRSNYYNSNQVSTPVKNSPAYLVNNIPYNATEIINKSPITPTESVFFPPSVVRSISPSVIPRVTNQASRSNSPYIRYTNGTMDGANVNNQTYYGIPAQNNARQRIFNFTNVDRENRHKIDINSDLEKVKERNTSLTKKLEILEEIVGNSGLELMEQKINKLLSENDRLSSILQENKGVTNKNKPSDDLEHSDLMKENERLNKIIQTQTNELELWKKRWNEAERASLNISKAALSQKDSTEKEKFSEILNEKTDEIEKLNKRLKQHMESSSIQELENAKKITILLQENDKLNTILNNQIDELDKLTARYQELESKQITNTLHDNQMQAIQKELTQNNLKMNKLLQENEFLMEKIKEQDKDLSSIKLLEQKIEMVVEENVKNNNLLKTKIEECEFYKKKNDEEKFNKNFLENDNHNQKLLIEEYKAKINILIDENKKLNESFTLKIGENVALSALEEKVEILMEENNKLNELNQKIRVKDMQNKNNYRNQPDESLIYKEKAEFLEKKNLLLMEEMEKMKQEFEKCVIENQQIGEIEMKTELLIEENSNLNNLLSQKDEEIFFLKKIMSSKNGAFEVENGDIGDIEIK